VRASKFEVSKKKKGCSVNVLDVFWVCFGYVFSIFFIFKEHTAALGPRGRSQIGKKQEKIQKL